MRQAQRQPASRRGRPSSGFRVVLAAVALASSACPVVRAAAPVERAYDIRALDQPPAPMDRPFSEPLGRFGDALARVVAHVLAEGPKEERLAPGGRARFSVECHEGRLLVAASPNGHEQVQKLLDHLGKSKNLAVHVLASFVELDDAALKALRGKLPFSPLGPPAKEKTDTTPTYALLDRQAAPALSMAFLRQGKGKLVGASRMATINARVASVYEARVYAGYVRPITGEDDPEIGGVPDTFCTVRPVVLPEHRGIVLMLSIPWWQAEAGRGPRMVGTVEAILTVPEGGTVLLADVPGHAPEHAKLPGNWATAEPRRSWIILLSAQEVPDIFEEE